LSSVHDVIEALTGGDDNISFSVNMKNSSLTIRKSRSSLLTVDVKEEDEVAKLLSEGIV
jgi:hypothetical protein